MTELRFEGYRNTCNGCGKPILWTVTLHNHREMPVDIMPTPKGNVSLKDEYLGDGESRLVSMVGEPLSLFDGEEYRWYPGYVSHFATCPYAHKFRRKS